jgi:hypothetical protein
MDAANRMWDDYNEAMQQSDQLDDENDHTKGQTSSGVVSENLNYFNIGIDFGTT